MLNNKRAGTKLILECLRKNPKYPIIILVLGMLYIPYPTHGMIGVFATLGVAASILGAIVAYTLHTENTNDWY